MSKVIADCSRKNNYSIAVLNDADELEYFSFENNQKKTIKSNIYLGKITRVEYSLQAAFVEYGGDKAGFLPFAEIHPNYYHIPTRDKQELLKHSRYGRIDDIDEDENNDINFKTTQKKYAIQEVIKRGQVVLVQVTKDERGNKGVSLTTYISLAGRYCVFMPNGNNGINISKRISSYEERKKILNMLKKLNIQEGSGIIVRTECLKATEDEILNDYNNLVRLWDEICKKTMHSKVGGGEIYKEINIVEQIIRDNYESSPKSQIIIRGEEGYENVVAFAKAVMPSELPKIRLYKDKMAIFKKYEIDKKLDELLLPQAKLPSGGYLVISPTEALVSIDVNSGHSIHGKNVEETALQTNLEAATEVARQLRLRNLGGLIVVDFIDMNEPRNRHILEKELQKAFMFDKARVQIAKISQFGLVEISRQRTRSNINEMMTIKCEHCNGTGYVKAPAIVSTDILDSIDENMQTNPSKKREFLEVVACPDVINHLVVQHIREIEDKQRKYNVKIITKKHNFDRNEEYILRSTDTQGDVNTAEELYHAIVAKFNAATEERRATNKTFKLLAKQLFSRIKFFKKKKQKPSRRR